MSRSVHTTRRQLDDLRRTNYADPFRQSEAIARATDRLQRKATIKARTVQERREGAFAETTGGVETIPILVRDEGPYTHYPAGKDDLRAMMRRLPPGSLDGVSRVVLCVGAEDQHEMADVENGQGERDPIVGRLGYEILLGVYGGIASGVYAEEDASIWLYAYIYEPEGLCDRQVKEHFLRLRTLSTLMHEVAHHHDRSACDRRGAWAYRSVGRREWSARNREYAWTMRYVVPYLEEAYPVETDALIQWVRAHAGAPLALSEMHDRPDELPFSTRVAIERLFDAVDAGEADRDIRLDFAHELRFAERYDEALRVIAAFIVEHPDDLCALTLQAGVYTRLRRYEEAERVALAVVGRDSAMTDAWKELARVYRAQGLWSDLARVCETALRLPNLNNLSIQTLLIERASALIELGDFEHAEADIERLAQYRGEFIQRDVMSLRALLLLRTGHIEEALGLAATYPLRSRTLPPRGILAAVRYEAAMRLRRPSEAGVLSARLVTLLREFGYGAWLRRLASSYGLRNHT